MANAAQIEEFRQAALAISSLAQDQLRDLLSSFGPGSDPKRVRDLLLRVFPDFMTTFGDTAAVLGADFYDLMRDLPPSSGTARTVLSAPAKTKQSEGTVRWAVGALFAEDPDWGAFETSLLGAAQRLVMLPARSTVDLMARSDARSGKVAAVGWGRRTDPARARSGKSCAWCINLAGRGPVYRSDAAAGAVVGRGSERTGFDENGTRLSGGVGGGVQARGARGLANDYHDNCHCVPVPTYYERVTNYRTPSGREYLSALVPISLLR
ncbi:MULTISPECIES: VG15 protein [unclassified Leucobacter]|uniref:VG15 protein n=1 Tax=unclassified Leucobacter TaxID=2621730 RepID=UPI0006214758|nr:hypothetical protein [Leucobacter sp. Ag1]KKI20555.1 hypothetical protein XM48_07485 [Leucobacter sp. Ag1]